MSEPMSRLTNEEAAEVERILTKTEDLDLLGDDREAWALKSTRDQFRSWLKRDTLQSFQTEVFKERAKDALLDQDQEKHERWMRLATRLPKEEAIKVDTPMARYLLRNAFLTGFSFALEALMTSSPEIGWTDVERQYPNRIREGLKIPGTVRVIQDRFARFFQDCRMPGECYAPLRDAVFESWKDWRT